MRSKPSLSRAELRSEAPFTSNARTSFCASSLPLSRSKRKQKLLSCLHRNTSLSRRSFRLRPCQCAVKRCCGARGNNSDAPIGCQLDGGDSSTFLLVTFAFSCCLRHTTPAIATFESLPEIFGKSFGKLRDNLVPCEFSVDSVREAFQRSCSVPPQALLEEQEWCPCV